MDETLWAEPSPRTPEYVPYTPEDPRERLERSFEQWLTRINGVNGEIIREQIMKDPEINHLILTAPGSRRAHQAFPGGYREHMRQTMMIASHLYELTQMTGAFNHLPPEERFDESDALLVMFLHDIEKPFLFEMKPDDTVGFRTQMTKPERTQFRDDFIVHHGFQLDDRHQNALDHVEGVRDHLYVPGQRADKPLAALCHAADNLSARLFYDYTP